MTRAFTQPWGDNPDKPSLALLGEVLPHLIDPNAPFERHPGRIMDVPVDAVCSAPWSVGRLARCRELLAAGKVAPPVDLTEVRVGREVFYLLTDGNHRTEAARLAGHETIRAEVDCTVTVGRHIFSRDTYGEGLWRPHAKRAGEMIHIGWEVNYSADEWRALKWLVAKQKEMK